ncbi:hypothetical protein PRIPAC_86645 [Pristionchus pacificus]|uniref:Uncharacterized protein n=1 Tax=Pristionchus pacificus TaxID=54126 RepID=A0A2A6BNW1_PRIPA|nr:hypothetical protein PRIPAC_86645 [Pristionchus pacificus]|eukprot:PDM67610.1 hypothetical protein PRIPAC_49027 [Pristionchus pacificus]
MTIAQYFTFLTVVSISGISESNSVNGLLQSSHGFIDENIEETANQIVNSMGEVVAYSTR